MYSLLFYTHHPTQPTLIYWYHYLHQGCFNLTSISLPFFSPSDWDFSFGFCCHADSDLFIYFCYRTMFSKVLKASLVSLTRLVVVPFQPFFSHPLFLFLCLKYSGLVTFSKLSWFYPSQYQLSIVIFQPAFRKNAAAAAYQDFATLKYTKKKPDLMQHLLQ